MIYMSNKEPEHHDNSMIRPELIEFKEYPDEQFVLNFTGYRGSAGIVLDKKKLEELRLKISVTQEEAEAMEKEANNEGN